MKILFIVFFSFILAFANVGKITAIKGDVSVKRDTKELKAFIGFILKKNDEVITKNKSKALLLFNDNTSITVGKNSSLQVNEFLVDENAPQKSKTEYKFNKGLFRTITGKIGKLNPKGFKIKTKSASIGIRGTDFIVNVTPTSTQAIVTEGEIFLQTTSGISVDIPAGMKSQATQDMQKPENPTVATQEDLKEMGADDVNEDKDLTTSKDSTNNKPKEKQEKKKTEQKETSNKNKTPQKKEKQNNPKPKNQSAQAKSSAGKNPPPPKHKPPLGSKPKATIKVKIEKDNVDTLSFEGEATVTNDINELNVNIKQVKIEQTTIEDNKKTPPPIQLNTETLEQLIEVVNDTPKEDIATQNNLLSQVATFDGDIVALLPSGEVVLSKDISSITEDIMKESYMELGYLKNDLGQKHATYITGTLTLESTINNYIHETGKTATYEGKVAAFVNGENSIDGTINLTLKYDNSNPLDGTINLNNDAWIANITGGVITPEEFNSKTISGSSPTGDITSGEITGRHYGTNAQAIGGTFNLKSDSDGDVHGVFGGNKK
jgi:hypothetical protein